MAAPAIKLEFPEEYKSEESEKKLLKRLDRFTQKGIEKITEFIGLTTTEAMFYIYLLKKYKSSCFLTAKSSDFWEIIGLNLLIREIYSVEEYEQISVYLEILAKKLVNCINNDVNIIIIPLGLTLFYPGKEESSGHANVLIYRKKFNHIEHFEPHGKTGSFDNEKLNRSIDLFLKLFVEYVNIELLKHKTPAQIQNLKPIELIESNKVCPRLRGFQSIEENSEILKFKEIEGGGYCAAWSMFFTELCLKNPEMTSNQIIESIFSAAFYKSLFFTTEDYFRHIIRGYVTFINEKISTYFKFLLDDNKIDIAKIKKMTLDESILLTEKMKMIISIEVSLTVNPNAIDERIMFLQNTQKQIQKQSVVPVLSIKRYVKNQLEIELLKKYKKYVEDFNSPLDTPLTPPPLSLVKTQKNSIICPPGKVLNPKTNRCVKDKPLKTIRQVINERKEELKQELRNITKECPPGKVLNPVTGRCIKSKVVKPVKLVIKKEPIICPPGKVLNPKTGRCVKSKVPTRKIKKELKKPNEPIICPPGKVLNPKTGRCIKAKVPTRKIKKEPMEIKESKESKETNETKESKEPNEPKETNEPNEPKETNESNEQKETNEIKEPANKLKECPPGKVLNPKTGRCVKAKVPTRKIKREPKG
jgi:hypothetical protein